MKKTNIFKSKLFLLLVVIIIPLFMTAQNIESPNGNFSLKFNLNEQREPVYELLYKEKVIIKPSKLGLYLKDDLGLINDFTTENIETSVFDETWHPVWSEESSIRNHYNEMIVF